MVSANDVKSFPVAALVVLQFVCGLAAGLCGANEFRRSFYVTAVVIVPFRLF